MGDIRDPLSITTLVEPGRVHRRVYCDPAIFELEMERIFGRAWLFVGHASQVPTPGDYVTMDLGRQPVIFTRHKDGNAMHYLVGIEIYDHLEKVMDRFEDVANRISGLVIEQV